MKTKINKESENRLISHLLKNKGMDIDKALDWIKKRFEVVPDKEFLQEQINKAKDRGIEIEP